MPRTHPPQILVSFIGKGIRAGRNNDSAQPATHAGYIPKQYIFRDPNYQSCLTPLFGIALIHYLKEIRQTPPEKWLVLGSPQSNWDALLEAVPKSQRDNEFNTVYSQLQQAVRDEEQEPSAEGRGSVTQDLLDRWSQALSQRLEPLQVECHLIGWSESPERQRQMWQILDERIPKRAALVLDITHGFRHQPMLLATMIVLMNYLKQFESVSFYYGALDMTKHRDDPATVLKIDLFPELLEYIRRLGVLQVAGEYESLGKYLLRNHFELKKEIETIAFKERANLDVAGVEAFVEKLQQWQPENDPIRETLKPILLEELCKHRAETPLERAAQRADEAIKHHDYLTAYTLLWEAIVSAGVMITQPQAQAQIDDPEVRRKAIETLLQPNYTSRSEANTLRAFRATRNWIVHGTEQRNRRAKQAIQSPKGLRDLYDEARQVFELLRSRIPASTPQTQHTHKDGGTTP